jgi:hypothetical protein
MLADKDAAPGWVARKWDKLKAIIAYHAITAGMRTHMQMFEVICENYMTRRAVEEAHLQADAEALEAGECPCPECREERRQERTLH